MLKSEGRKVNERDRQTRLELRLDFQYQKQTPQYRTPPCAEFVSLFLGWSQGTDPLGSYHWLQPFVLTY